MNNLTVTEPTLILTDTRLKDIIVNSEYDSDKEISFLRLDSGVINVHAELEEFTKKLIHCEVFIYDARVCLSDEQKEFIRNRLEHFCNDIGWVGESTEDPAAFEKRIDELNEKF